MKVLIFAITNNLWFYFRKMHFHPSCYHFVKVRQPCFYHLCVFETKPLVFKIKLMHVGFSGYLKHVGSFTSFRYLQFSPNVFLVESSMHELKSPSKINYRIQMLLNLQSWKESPDVILYFHAPSSPEQFKKIESPIKSSFSLSSYSKKMHWGRDYTAMLRVVRTIKQPFFLSTI